MVTVRKVNEDRLEALVRIAYADDVEGFNKYHLKKFTYEEAVNKTMEMAEEMKQQVPLNYFEVLYNEIPIGYFITFPECLYSFCISKKYRLKKGLINEWWLLVKNELPDLFICIIYRNNTRAIKFLQKMGMIEMDSNFEDRNLITLVNI